jgi:transposase
VSPIVGRLRRRGNPVRVTEVFIDELDLGGLGFARVHPASTGRPAYHPFDAAEDLSLRLTELDTIEPPPRAGSARNIELMWLTGRPAPDFKTIASFRRDHSAAICAVCGQFIELCHALKRFTKVDPSTDRDFNQAAQHPTNPIKCRTSTERTQAPDDVKCRSPQSSRPLTH